MSKAIYKVYSGLSGGNDLDLDDIFEDIEEARQYAQSEKNRMRQDFDEEWVFKITITIENDLELI